MSLTPEQLINACFQRIHQTYDGITQEFKDDFSKIILEESRILEKNIRNQITSSAVAAAIKAYENTISSFSISKPPNHQIQPIKKNNNDNKTNNDADDADNLDFLTKYNKFENHLRAVVPSINERSRITYDLLSSHKYLIKSRIFYLYGTGNNGKTSLLNTIKDTFPVISYTFIDTVNQDDFNLFEDYKIYIIQTHGSIRETVKVLKNCPKKSLFFIESNSWYTGDKIITIFCNKKFIQCPIDLKTKIDF